MWAYVIGGCMLAFPRCVGIETEDVGDCACRDECALSGLKED